MMDYPLTLRSLYERARTLFPDKQLVSRRASGEVARSSYGDWAERVARLATALRDLGVGPGDRVGTFCWNHDRHLEVYFAAALSGASYHTVNIRLGPDQIAYIINHAHDKVLVADADLARAAPLADAAWPELDERQTAGICYASATTGNPKGVAYSHRALFLHSLMVGLVDTAAISEAEVLLPIVPMFHVNAWGLPFAATWFGAAQVFGGPHPSPADYVRLIREAGVSVSAAVSPGWLGVLRVLVQD